MNSDLSLREAQFELERNLRTRILNSRREDRHSVTVAAYEELFRKFPQHSVFQVTDEERQQEGRLGAGMIVPLSRPGHSILEIGCGRGDVLLALARCGRRCYGVEPSQRMLSMCQAHQQARIVFGTADELSFPDDSFDLVFSQQVLEHLHPDDVPECFAEAFRVIRPGGILSVETPNRRTGPQDISRGFTKSAQGLHLKEWSVCELVAQFRRAGFVGIRGLLAPSFLARRSTLLHRIARVPALVKYIEDIILGFIPTLNCRTLAGKLLGLDDLYIFAKKPGELKGDGRRTVAL